MKEHSKASERELSDEEVANLSVGEFKANLSDGEFKALEFKMLTELIEPGRKMKKQMKDSQSGIKQNIQGTNSDRKKPGLKAMTWNKRKK